MKVFKNIITKHNRTHHVQLISLTINEVLDKPPHGFNEYVEPFLYDLYTVILDTSNDYTLSTIFKDTLSKEERNILLSEGLEEGLLIPLPLSAYSLFTLINQEYSLSSWSNLL